MSVIWMDDPGFYNSSELTARYNTVSMNVTAGAGRFGGNAWDSGLNAFPHISRAVPSATTGTLAGSFSITSEGGGLLTFEDTGTPQVDVRVSSGGFLSVTRNGTILATSTNALLFNTWYRIEFKTTISSSAGTAEVHVNGAPWIGPLTGLNTQNTANATFNTIVLGSLVNSGLVFFANDFVYTDNNSPNADFLGDIRSYLLRPNANASVQYAANWASWSASTVMVIGQQVKDSNGNVQQVTAITSDAKTGASAPAWATTGGVTTVDNHVTWTVVGTGANPGAANWMAISETIADGDNSYNSSSTPGQIDLFTLPSLPATAVNIVAVDTVVYARKDDAGTRTVAPYVSSSGTTAAGPNIPLSTTYVFGDFIQQADPHTSAAWTPAGVNALEIGYEEIA